MVDVILGVATGIEFSIGWGVGPGLNYRFKMGAGRCGVKTNVDVLVKLTAKTRTINIHPNDPDKLTIKPK